MDEMQPKRIHKFKWFWAWQDEQEEDWLSEMAANGYHLDEPVFPCIYRFEVGEPAEIVYRLDYPQLKNRDRASYLQLFEDAGWEHTGDLLGWVYFRRALKEGEPIEIYSDAESKIHKYRRILAYLIILLPIMVILRPDVETGYFGNFGRIISGAYFFLMLLWAFSIINLIRRIDQLKKSS
jgi:hypothetical protein